MSNEIVIDLTENLANIGEKTLFEGKFVPDVALLPYPEATLTLVSVKFCVSCERDSRVLVDGEIECRIEGNCDRCLKSVSRQISLPFEQVFFKDLSPDDDAYVYRNSMLDVTKAVCDEIILSMPSLLLCDEECKGLCPKCGADLNKGECGCSMEKENAFSILKNIKF